jgi:hypothetical protein
MSRSGFGNKNVDIKFSAHNVYMDDLTASGLLLLGGIVSPVVNVSALTWFIRYIYY